MASLSSYKELCKTGQEFVWDLFQRQSWSLVVLTTMFCKKLKLIDEILHFDSILECLAIYDREEAC
jgi:hypothetical protein